MEMLAQKKESYTFNDYVDYPKLCESFKGHLTSMVTQKIGQSGGFFNSSAAMGTALSLAMANQMIEAMVRTETMMRVIQGGKIAPQVNASGSGTTQQQAPPTWLYEASVQTN